MKHAANEGFSPNFAFYLIELYVVSKKVLRFALAFNEM
ncbi:MAG: hypothetical protein ACI8ZM_002852 [Crocinitomix sp.]|jgi:hypothetical protein